MALNVCIQAFKTSKIFETPGFISIRRFILVVKTPTLEGSYFILWVPLGVETIVGLLSRCGVSIVHCLVNLCITSFGDRAICNTEKPTNLVNNSTYSRNIIAPYQSITLVRLSHLRFLIFRLLQYIDDIITNLKNKLKLESEEVFSAKSQSLFDTVFIDR